MAENHLLVRQRSIVIAAATGEIPPGELAFLTIWPGCPTALLVRVTEQSANAFVLGTLDFERALEVGVVGQNRRRKKVGEFEDFLTQRFHSFLGFAFGTRIL